MTGSIDFKGIACNPDELLSYLVFPSATNVTLVSESLCGINDTMVGNITDFLQRQLDIAAIIRIVCEEVPKNLNYHSVLSICYLSMYLSMDDLVHEILN